MSKLKKNALNKGWVFEKAVNKWHFTLTEG
jgi:hypothetical protein